MASNPISASQVTSDQVSTIVATVTEVVSAIEGIVAASGVGNALSIAQIEQLTKLFGNLAGVAVQAAHNIFGRDITPESVMELMPVGTALAKPTE